MFAALLISGLALQWHFDMALFTIEANGKSNANDTICGVPSLIRLLWWWRGRRRLGRLVRVHGSGHNITKLHGSSPKRAHYRKTWSHKTLGININFQSNKSKQSHAT